MNKKHWEWISARRAFSLPCPMGILNRRCAIGGGRRANDGGCHVTLASAYRLTFELTAPMVAKSPGKHALGQDGPYVISAARLFGEIRANRAATFADSDADRLKKIPCGILGGNIGAACNSPTGNLRNTTIPRRSTP